MMDEWITPSIAVWSMLIGILPSVWTIWLLYPERRKPSVLWFLVSMGAGGLWAALYVAFTVIDSPTITLALANVFWAIVPLAAVSLFLLAYEYVFKETVHWSIAATLCTPIAALFLASWVNPADLVYTAEYGVDSSGFLQFSFPEGILHSAVVQVYGYLLAFLAAGMFLGEILRTRGARRTQTLSLLVVFSALVGSTAIKVLGYVPIYYDPTATVYAFSGLIFAYSIKRNGLLRSPPVAREQTFQNATDAIVVLDPQRTVLEINRYGRTVLGPHGAGTPAADVFPWADETTPEKPPGSIQILVDGTTRHFSLQTSRLSYGRGLECEIVTLSDVTSLKKREQELDLVKKVLSRTFRHNIRNDLTVITGCASMISDRSEGRISELADIIGDEANHLLGQAEKVRTLEKVLKSDGTVEASLQQTVLEAVPADVQNDSFTVDTNVVDRSVIIHPQFHLAVAELIENAQLHAGSEPPVTLRIWTELDDDAVRLCFQDDGSGIPQEEIDALTREVETTLTHSSGIGLWLVHWLVRRSDGQLAIESTDAGTRIEIRLVTANPGPSETGRP